MQTVCSLKSIKPMRMLLFGTIGCLLPITIYLFLTDTFLLWFSQVDFILDILIIPVLLLSAFCTWLGFRLSSDIYRISIDTKGMIIESKPRFPLFSDHTSTFTWNKVSSYRLIEDGRGNLLRLYFSDGSSFTIAQAFILDRSTNFKTFFLHFDIYVQLYRIPENPGLF